MWSPLLAALVGTVASLAGVTLGALVEPWKLSAAERSRMRRDRLDRCANLIEAANDARQQVVGLNILHRRLSLTEAANDSDRQREVEYEDRYYAPRARLRSSLALLVMSGPDELIELGEAVRDADVALHNRRLTLDGEACSPDSPRRLSSSRRRPGWTGPSLRSPRPPGATRPADPGRVPTRPGSDG